MCKEGNATGRGEDQSWAVPYEKGLERGWGHDQDRDQDRALKAHLLWVEVAPKHPEGAVATGSSSQRSVEIFAGRD